MDTFLECGGSGGGGECSVLSLYRHIIRDLDPRAQIDRERSVDSSVLSRHRSASQMNWQVQQAKQQCSELIRRTLDEGPQVVTRHGEEVVVVVSVDEFRRSRMRQADLGDFLLSGPDFDLLDLERRRELPRVTDLDA